MFVVKQASGYVAYSKNCGECSQFHGKTGNVDLVKAQPKWFFDLLKCGSSFPGITILPKGSPQELNLSKILR